MSGRFSPFSPAAGAFGARGLTAGALGRMAGPTGRSMTGGASLTDAIGGKT